MKTATKQQIIDIIQKIGQARPKDLIDRLGFSPVAIHKHLKNLINQGLIVKVGSPPHVFYKIRQISAQTSELESQLDLPLKKFLNQNYLYISPQGNLLFGTPGFCEWAQKTRQMKNMGALAAEYKKIREEANQFYVTKQIINAQFKLTQIYKNPFVDQLYYSDFYSLPKFGKTRLGQLVLHAKQAQDKKIIHQLADEIRPTMDWLVKKHTIEALAIIPHSIPRKIPFLKALEKNLNMGLPVIPLVKAYAGEIPVAQKSLSKLEERIENARNTIFVKDANIPHTKILLLDDALGSGASMNETAHKLKQIPSVKKVVGYVIVGSYKGFEVIREI